MKINRVMIAGAQSGAGKTTLTLGILAALRRRGIKVQPYKVGPDYIDPGLHCQAAGRISHNLDSWMGDERVVKQIFLKNAGGADLCLVEGVMGLFDGARGERLKGSSAHIALILDLPVILVVNARGMGRSCLPLIKGFQEYEPRLKLAGVILNNAGSSYYRTEIKTAIEEELGLPVLGCLPRDREIVMPERHLGLLPAEENPRLQTVLAQMADLVEGAVDLEGLLQVAAGAPALTGPPPAGEEAPGRAAGPVVIGVARDEAFSFYYQDNLDFLAELGASLVYFSPLRDRELPSVDGLYLGGGFPEMFLPELAGNGAMKESLRRAFAGGMPMVAECGGFVYLAETIVDFAGNSWEGVGLVPATARMEERLAALGYVEARALRESPLAEQGDCLRGHEFHYSVMAGLPEAKAAYVVTGGGRRKPQTEGYVDRHLVASYLHLHWRSNPRAAARFVDRCRQYRRTRAGR